MINSSLNLEMLRAALNTLLTKASTLLQKTITEINLDLVYFENNQFVHSLKELVEYLYELKVESYFLIEEYSDVMFDFKEDLLRVENEYFNLNLNYGV